MPQQVRIFPAPAVATDYTVVVPSVAGSAITCTTNGTAALTSAAAFASVFPGMKIAGTGILPGTTVLSIASVSALTLSQAASDSSAGGRQFSYDAPFWRFRSLHAKLTCSAAVANRDVKIFIDDGTNPVWMATWGI